MGEKPIAVTPRMSAVRLNALRFGEEGADAARMMAWRGPRAVKSEG